MSQIIYKSLQDLEALAASMVKEELQSVESSFTYVSKAEERFIRKLAKIISQVQKKKLPFEYDDRNGRLVFKKTLDGKKYPYIMYIDVYDDGTYGFGGDTEDLFCGTAVQTAKAAAEWMSNEEPSCR